MERSDEEYALRASNSKNLRGSRHSCITSSLSKVGKRKELWLLSNAKRHWWCFTLGLCVWACCAGCRYNHGIKITALAWASLNLLGTLLECNYSHVILSCSSTATILLRLLFLESGGDVRVFHGWHACLVDGCHGGGCHEWHLSGGGCLCGRGGLLLLGQECGRVNLFLGFQNGDNVIEWDLGSDLSLGVVGEHDLDLDSDDTLAHENVTDRHIGVDLSGVSRLDHVSVTEFHGLGTLSTELSGDNNLASLGGRFHDESDHTVAGTADGESSEEFEFERFGLGLGAQSTVLDTLGVQLDGTVGKVETLLDDRRQLTDALPLFTQHVLGAGSPDNDFRAVGGGTDLHSGVPILGQLTSQQLVQFGVKDSIGNELALGRQTATASRHFFTFLKITFEVRNKNVRNIVCA